ncbi:MAG: isocitrate lyase/PEP mutase family protein [Caulobacteraceae bacterium]
MSETLRARLKQPKPVLAPGCYDALSAFLIEQAGFEAMYLSGASVAYTQLGRPDIGLVSFDQIADVTRRIRERTDIPLIVDADTGFGNALHVQRTVRVLERSGANAIQLEDQSFPKRCGHLGGKMLVSAQEMANKVRAAVDARTSEDTLIMARTDAIAVEGLEAALDRARMYKEAGADIIFVEAPRSIDEMKTIVSTLGGSVPLLANMVEGGTTPISTLDELDALGFRLVISPGALVRAYMFMAQRFLSSLKENGTTQPTRETMVNFEQLNNALGIKELAKLGEMYDPAMKLEAYRSAGK